MSRFQEMHDSLLKRSTLSDEKLLNDRLNVRTHLSNESGPASNIFQKSPIDQILRKIHADDATKMQNGLWKVRISKYANASALDVIRLLRDSDQIESAQFFEEDNHTLTLIVRLSDEV